MASEWTAYGSEHNFPYQFKDLALLEKALIAGDSNSDDREGHRGMAQVGDALLSFIITSEGYDRGISRQEQQENISLLKSKKKCSTLARIRCLDKFVRISERQAKDGPQPTTLKNTLTAIVAAVWLDSRDYHAIVQVMAFLGLVNSAEPSASPQNAIHADSTSPSSTEFVNSSYGSAEIDHMMNDFNFDAFPDTDILGLNWMSTASQMDIPSDCLAADAFQGLESASQLDQHEIEIAAQTATFEEWLALEDPTGTLDPSTQDVGCVVEHSGHRPNQETNHASIYRGEGDLNSNGGPMNNWIDPISPDSSSQPSGRHRAELVSARGSDSNKRRNSREGSLVHIVFKAYISREVEKLKARPELFTPHYNHMKPYRDALSSIKTPHPKALANMAVAIGDCSAMLLFKQAIESIRSPEGCALSHIGRSMPHEQRLEAIYRLDLCMAHTRLARWLHIYKLYDDLSHEAGGKDTDGFVVLTNADLEQDSTRPLVPAQRGNPRNLEQTTITRRMMDCANVDNRGGARLEKTKNSMKRLRRIGHRLQMLVVRWRLGVLSLLDTTFTDELVMTVTDPVFNQFIKVVDRFEGRRIRELSAAAEPAVRLFMENDVVLPKMRIEVMEEDVIQQLPRLSEDMKQLFSVVDGI